MPLIIPVVGTFSFSHFGMHNKHEIDMEYIISLGAFFNQLHALNCFNRELYITIKRGVEDSVEN